MSEIVVETLEDETFGGFTIVVQAPPDVWRQLESNKPGYVEWNVYEIQGYNITDGEPGVATYWKKGESSNFPGTHDWHDAEPDASGSVKWDGCCNFNIGDENSLAHACNADSLGGLLRAVQRAYDISLEMVGGGLV